MSSTTQPHQASSHNPIKAHHAADISRSRRATKDTATQAQHGAWYDYQPHCLDDDVRAAYCKPGVYEVIYSPAPGLVSRYSSEDTAHHIPRRGRRDASAPLPAPAAAPPPSSSRVTAQANPVRSARAPVPPSSSGVTAQANPVAAPAPAPAPPARSAAFQRAYEALVAENIRRMEEMAQEEAIARILSFLGLDDEE